MRITNNLALAAALIAVGIPTCAPHFTKVKSVRGEQYTFYFDDNGKSFDTGELMKAWHDEKWDAENESHPFVFVKRAFGNREKLLDLVNKAIPYILVEKGKGFALIPQNATEEEKNLLLSNL